MNVFFCQLIFFCISCILRVGQYYFYELEFLSLRKGEGNEKAGFGLRVSFGSRDRYFCHGAGSSRRKSIPLKRESLGQLYPKCRRSVL